MDCIVYADRVPLIPGVEALAAAGAVPGQRDPPSSPGSLVSFSPVSTPCPPIRSDTYSDFFFASLASLLVILALKRRHAGEHRMIHEQRETERRSKTQRWENRPDRVPCG